MSISYINYVYINKPNITLTYTNHKLTSLSLY